MPLVEAGRGDLGEEQIAQSMNLKGASNYEFFTMVLIVSSMEKKGKVSEDDDDIRGRLVANWVQSISIPGLR